MNYEQAAERIAERAQRMLSNAAVDPVLQPDLARQVIKHAAMQLLPFDVPERGPIHRGDAEGAESCSPQRHGGHRE